MSGQSKEKRISFFGTKLSVITLFYVLVVLVLFASIYILPKVYDKIEENRTTYIKSTIESILSEEQEVASRDTAFKKLVSKYAIDLVVLDQGTYDFKTLPSSDFKTIDAWLNKQAISYYSSYTLEISGMEYQVWLVIYNSRPQTFFEYTILFFSVLILVLFTLILVLILSMFKRLLTPINRLKDNILKLKEFKLNEVSHIEVLNEYDGLSSELSEFTDDLQGKIDTMGVRYTALERELQAKQERMTYKDQLVGAVIHDLKTPITTVSLQVEKLQEDYEGDEELVSRLARIEDKNQKMLEDIKEAIQMIHTEKIDVTIETLDFTKMIQETIKRFKPFLTEKKIYTTIDIPPNLEVQMNKIEAKQLLHNIVSNVTQYTKEEGHFELSAYQEEENLKIEVYNDSQDSHNIDFDQVFDLFYHTKTESNHYSTGVGMYTIKATVEKYGGSCRFQEEKEGVRLEICLPLDAEGQIS